MSLNSTKRNVFGLFAGIKDYRSDLIVNGVYFPKLLGCVNDATSVQGFLQNDPGIELHPLCLFDGAATKPAIVHAFRTHLSKAKTDDCILVYYSGHGSTETADAGLWTDESGGRLEAIVCYYDHARPHDFLLTDKELRFLIHELYEKTKAHIVTIFDCCHSGDNTRAMVEEGIVEKRVDFTFPQRKYEDFIFAGQIPASAFSEKKLAALLPQGAHVQMSASESDEPAVEAQGKGAFTKYLLEALRLSNGNISYRDLHSRVRNRMKAVFEQKPKLYAPDGHRALLQSGFLKKETGTASSGNMDYNQASKCWVLDKGVLHGIAPGTTTVTAAISSTKKAVGKAGKAELDHALLQFSDDDLVNLDQLLTYSVELHGTQQQEIRVRMVNKNASPEEAETLADRLESPENAGYIALDDNPAKAGYDLVLWNDLYYITRPGDWFRPLAEPVAAEAKDAAGTVGSYLRHISNWTYLNRLANTGSNALPASNLQVDFFKLAANGAETPIAPSADNSLRLDLEKMNQPGKKWGGQLKIVLTNRSKANLYVAAVFQSEDFSSEAGLLEPSVKMVQPGKSEAVWGHNGGAIPLQLDEKWLWYNWKEGRETLKFVFSTSPFDGDALQKAGLPPPPMPGEKRDRGSLDLKSKAPVLSGWAALDFHLVIPNPEFDVNNEQKVATIYKGVEEAERQGGDVSLAHFASGLYLQQNGLDAKAAAPPDDSELEKGFLWDATLATANRWSRFWRNRNFTKTCKRLPNQPRLLAEGDSWFQHPLVTDVIDCIGRFYPVECLSAAGDTIRNYIKSGEFIQEIVRLNPKVFLLSGGGNDILGESMMKFLADGVPENSSPDQFFNDNLRAELAALTEIYRTIFGYYKANSPDLHIIVHGYDYPRPVPPGSKKTNWLGQYFDKKGILNETDRQAAVRFMMDRFNESLAAVAAEFPNVHYLDLRNIVRDDQWYDEIHPNNDGFQNVALKFIQKLNELNG